GKNGTIPIIKARRVDAGVEEFKFVSSYRTASARFNVIHKPFYDKVVKYQLCVLTLQAESMATKGLPSTEIKGARFNTQIRPQRLANIYFRLGHQAQQFKVLILIHKSHSPLTIPTSFSAISPCFLQPSELFGAFPSQEWIELFYTILFLKYVYKFTILKNKYKKIKNQD
ncbi:hypothetical protein M8C21_025324, partial [Ambrosia artemisiifolia]